MAWGLLMGLDSLVSFFKMLPVNFLPHLSQIGKPIIVSFIIFPALTVGLRYGYKKGLSVLIVTFLVRQIFVYSPLSHIEFSDHVVKLSPEGFALLAGILMMLFFAIREKVEDKSDQNAQLIGLFSQRMARIRKNIPLLSIMGGLVAAATAAGTLAGDPISLQLLKTGEGTSAGLAALARALGFIPLVGTTAIATGVYGPAGMTFVFVVGIFVHNPLVAFIAGAVVIAAEIMLLSYFAKILDQFPGIKACTDNIRTSMGRVLEIALLIGGMLAAEAMVSKGNAGLGFFFVTAVYVLNKVSKKPLVDLAVGPVAAILFGIVLNILYALHLYAI